LSTSTKTYADSGINLKGASFCPSCLRLAPAAFHKDKYLRFAGHCPAENKDFERIISKNGYPGQWKKEFLPRNWPKLKVELGKEKFTFEDIINWEEIPSFLFFVNKTCNTNCKICYERDKDKLPDFNFNNFISFLGKIRNKNKSIILFGGEPTLHNNLRGIIEATKKSGNTPVVFTNGLKLADKNFLQGLKDSGLETIFLSFDGFDPKTYALLRDNPGELNLKLQALENIAALGLKATLHTTVVQGINRSQIHPILDFTAKNKFIQGVNFKSIYLEPEVLNNFGEQIITDIEMIMQDIGEYFNSNQRIFNKFDALRQELVEFIVKNKIPVNLPVFRFGGIYTQRRQNKLSLAMEEAVLDKIIDILRNKRYAKLVFQPQLSRWAIYILLMKINRAFFQRLAEKDNVVPILVSFVTKKFDTVFGLPYSWPITLLEFQNADLYQEVFPIVDFTPY